VSLSDNEAGVDRELEARASARLGETLRDKYRLDRVLGFGGMATVYAATHRNGKEVALKLLHPEFADHSEVRDRFLREGYVANQVKHAGAVSVLDDDVTDSGGAFLVMELLSGVTVQEFWEQRDHRVHPAWVTAITLQVLDVIAAAHANGIIHRDLKPANLFLTLEGEVKVLDFGIARMRAMGAHTTNVNAVLGTPAFMAPEQAMGRMKEVDETTDLWAVAAVAFALLVGDVVHPAESSQATLIYAATRPARALGPLAPDTPAAIVSVLERALAFERSARWPSASAMREALVAASIEAYAELPDAAVLREALGVTKKRAVLTLCEETIELITPGAGEVAAAPHPAPAPGHQGTLRVVNAPSRALATSAIVTTSGVVTGGVDSVLRPLRARVSNLRVWALTAAVVIGLAAFAFPSVRAADRSIAVASASPVIVNAESTSSLSFVTTDPREGNLAVVAEPVPPVEAVVPTPMPTAEPARPRAAAPSANVSRVAVPASSGSKTSCTPPFVLDRASGLKKWKLECL
jgi:eukaryotic-like serine/threonine-protein kinase